MKKLFAITLVALTMLITACDDKPVLPSQLPPQITAFVQQNFPGRTISFAQKDYVFFGSKYDVVLDDATSIEFDTDNMWDKIDCQFKPVPATVIPAPITTTATANFPGAIIVSIDHEHYGYEVKLNNGLELKFNKQGALIDMDD